MGICITGIGAVCAAGSGPTALWEAVADGNAQARLREFMFGDEAVSLPVAAVPSGCMSLPEFPGIARLDRSGQLAIAAGHQAWHDAGLHRHPPDARRVAVFLGTSRGPIGRWEEAGERQQAGKRQLPSLAATGTIASLSGALAHHLGATGPCMTVSSTCASAASAIALGAAHIASGAADAAVVGGAEAPLGPTVMSLMQAANLLGSHEDPTRACRPFDRTRNGLVPGEASAVLILESISSAKARHAIPLARLSGWSTGLSHSGKTGVDESGDGLAEIISASLSMASVKPAEIGYLNAHGTGTLLNDLAEAKAIRRAFGKDCPPCSSTKPVTGHCLGATPALEAIICIRAIQHALAPPTANCQQADPAIDLDLVLEGARPCFIEHALSTSIGFWGNHASLLFSSI